MIVWVGGGIALSLSTTIQDIHGFSFSRPKMRLKRPLYHLPKKLNVNNCEIMAIRSDNGTKFKNYTMDEFLSDEGIKHQYSAAYTPQKNGVAERKNMTLIEMARTMLDEYKSPYKLWAEAIKTTCPASNRLYLRKLKNKTPYELLTGMRPNVKYFRVFGCKCFILNKNPVRSEEHTSEL